MRERPAGPGAAEVIRSPTNQTLKHVRSLQHRKSREAEGAFVVEGRRALQDALAAGARPRLVLLREDVAAGLPEPGLPARVPVRIVAPALFDALSATVTPQGVLAVFPIPALPLGAPRAPLFAIFDRIRDPGNLGTLLRSAAGAGATGALLTAGSVDPYSPKVVRAAMGAHFRLPIRSLTPELEEEIRVACPLRVVADAAATLPYDALDWTQPAALIVGSEATGPSAEMLALATRDVSIPLAGGVESLNAAVAGSIILFEAARQRRRGPRRSARPVREC